MFLYILRIIYKPLFFYKIFSIYITKIIRNIRWNNYKNFKITATPHPFFENLCISNQEITINTVSKKKIWVTYKNTFKPTFNL